MRIFYHAINGTGLGHLMRLSAIAAAVRDRVPDVHQFMATSANYPAHLRRLGVPSLILPGDDASPQLASEKSRRTVTSGFSMRMLRHAIREYDPRLVVFDTHAPRRLIEDVRSDGRLAALVFRRCRDAYVASYLDNGFFASFDRVLIADSHQGFRHEMSEELALRLDALGTLRYTGGIAWRLSLDRRHVARVAAHFGVKPGERLIVICAGSGGYGPLNQAFQQRAARAAVALGHGKHGARVLVIGGPYATPAGVPAGCTWVDEAIDLQLLFARADVVVSHAGYNSTQEVLRTGARAILVPVQRAAEDQAILARSLEHRGGVRVLPPTASQGQFLAALQELLAEPPPRREDVDGADRAAHELITLAQPPVRFWLDRAAHGAPGVVACATVDALVDGLRGIAPRQAVVRSDWRELPRLVEALGPWVHACLHGIEVDLGDEGGDSRLDRAGAALGILIECGFDREAIVLSFEDELGGGQLAQLAEHLVAYRFRALVARVRDEVLGASSRATYEALERCRKLPLGFRVDVTMGVDPIAFVDQP